MAAGHKATLGPGEANPKRRGCRGVPFQKTLNGRVCVCVCVCVNVFCCVCVCVLFGGAPTLGGGKGTS